MKLIIAISNALIYYYLSEPNVMPKAATHDCVIMGDGSVWADVECNITSYSINTVCIKEVFGEI